MTLRASISEESSFSEAWEQPEAQRVTDPRSEAISDQKEIRKETQRATGRWCCHAVHNAIGLLSAQRVRMMFALQMASETNGRVSPLKGLDYSVVQQCMHCGMCLPTCPTYDATKMERNSPRGRIALMRAIADGNLEATEAFADEMYFCLGCLACMTACPAGVNYAELFEHARAEAEQSGVLESPRRTLIRTFTLRWLFMDLNRLQLVGRALRLYQQLALQTLLRRSGVLKLLPKRLRELEAMAPPIQKDFSSGMISPVTRSIGPKRYHVAVLAGCAQ